MMNESLTLKKVCLLFGLLLVSCSSTSPQPEPVLIEPVGEVALLTSNTPPPEHALLDIGVVVFTASRPATHSTRPGESIYQQIAENEAHYLPFVLRKTLQDSNQWGAVRVLPDADPALDLTLRGTLIDSNGLSLQLHLTAIDSTGREWINKTYRDESRDEDYPGPDPFLRAFSTELPDASEGHDPFVDIYRQISNDLLVARDLLSVSQLERINQVTDMRYAADLSPQMFERFLLQAPDGLLDIQGLPASDDPMLARVHEIRLRHYVFIDTIDEYYESLYQEMQAPYALWRRYSRDQTLEDLADEQREQRSLATDTGSFSSMSQSYNRYMWAKLFAQEFRELAAGFNNEVAPAILALNQQVHGLSGPVEEQYAQWREILRQIFELETGATPSSAR